MNDATSTSTPSPPPRKPPVRPTFLIAAIVTLLVAGFVVIRDLALSQSEAPIEQGSGLTLERIAGGLENPVQLLRPAGDSRLFIVEQFGKVLIWKNGTVSERPFLDIRRQISTGYERGLLSIAFHPRFAENRQLFVSYTDKGGDTRVERWRVGDDPDVADPKSAELVLAQEQPYANHNGGLIAFGLDGMLYIGLGDGGSGGDPKRNGQNLGTKLGKLLRIDVDGQRPYRVPPDNPFVGRSGAEPEIWAYGLRNPWQFSFDATSGTLFIGDVGQNAWEEVDAAPASRGGLNYGWNLMEGRHPYRRATVSHEGMTLPVVEYPSREGCTVIGGFVYRGRRHPELVGHYFYADHCQGWIRSFKWNRGRVTEHQQWRLTERLQPSAFGIDAQGELYVVSLSGSVYRIGFESSDS
jgi:glucose/arabinose dehydrogenase